MNSKLLYLLSIIFLILAFLILFSKGYFTVRKYDVDREEIASFLINQDRFFNNFFLISESAVRDRVLMNFSDVENLKIQKQYFKFTIKVDVINKSVQFTTNLPNTYIDSDGKLFKSNLDAPLDAVKVDISSIYSEDLTKIFEKEEIEFVKSLISYPNITIVCKNRYFEIRYTDRDDFYIEVYQISDYLKLSESLNSEIKKLDSKDKQTVFLILGNRIVIKK